MPDPVTTGAPSGSAAASSAASATVSGATPPSASTTAGSTTAPAAGAPAPSGEPPPERWPDILQNARSKTRAEVEAQYRERYGWAEQFQADPYPFVESWIDQLATHPQYSQPLMSKIARLLQGRRQAQPAPEPKPDIPVTDGAGNVVAMTYSDRQMAARDDWRWQQREAQLTERFQPLEALRTRLEQAEQAAAFAQSVKTRSQADATDILTELRQDPWFVAHEADVKLALAEHEEWGDNIHRALAHVLKGAIPQEQGRLLTSLQTQASSSTVHPGQSTPAGTPKFRNFREAAEYFDTHPEEARAMAKLG